MNDEQLAISIAMEWLAAFNNHDLERILALYHADARHYSPKLKLRQPETHGWITGKEALRTWWQDSFDRLPTLQYIPTVLTANNERVFIEYVRKVEGEEDTKIAEALEIVQGLIIASRVYHG